MSFEHAGVAGLIKRSFFSAQECAAIIALAEQQGFESAPVRASSGVQKMPHIRNNQRTTFEEPRWHDIFWERLAKLDLPEIGGQVAKGLPRELRFYKYEPGERFKMHKDGPWIEDGLTSQLTALVYLNEGFKGGDTAFRDFTFTPETGALLLFPHATWHEGSALVSGTKYVLRSDVLYA